jgi:hypothetical protein
MNKKLIVYGVGFILTSLLLSLILVLNSPNRFVQLSIRGDLLLVETQEELQLSNAIYLLYPDIRLQQRLNNINWIDSYSIARTLPNQLDIMISVKRPIVCNDNHLYFTKDRVLRNLDNDSLCDSVIVVLGQDVPEEAIYSLDRLSEDDRNLIERIEFQRNQATVTMRGGQTAIVYPDDFSGLRSVAKLTPSGTVLDLRQNYE